MKRTPAPWEVDDQNFGYVWHGDNVVSASANHEDALLIAAAPDLLAACETLLAVNSYWWQEANGADDLIRAAVKKAKGE
jgi:hypothetical protein